MRTQLSSSTTPGEARRVPVPNSKDNKHSSRLSKQRIKDAIHLDVSERELAVAKYVDLIRPRSLRSFDQIPMLPEDHVRQIKLIAPYLENQSVALMGDSDCVALMLALLGKKALPRPRYMCIFDFDERLLHLVRRIADSGGFGHVLDTQRYNVFDPLPFQFVGQFDWFYTNPPYGSHNEGASARLFITRGCEMVRPGGQGCMILPDDEERPWTQRAMRQTQRMLAQHDWYVAEKVNNLHSYRLDDDPGLTSSLVLIAHDVNGNRIPMPFAGQRVAPNEIPQFYGRNVHLPYPRYVSLDATFDYDWETGENVAHV